MMRNDPVVDSLLAENPFKDSSPPKFVRALHYRYEFTKPASSSSWWKRRLIGEYVPVVSLQDLQGVYMQFGWEV